MILSSWTFIPEAEVLIQWNCPHQFAYSQMHLTKGWLAPILDAQFLPNSEVLAEVDNIWHQLYVCLVGSGFPRYDLP